MTDSKPTTPLNPNSAAISVVDATNDTQNTTPRNTLMQLHETLTNLTADSKKKQAFALEQLRQTLDFRAAVLDSSRIPNDLTNALHTALLKFQPDTRTHLHRQLYCVGALMRESTREVTLTKDGDTKIKYKALDIATIVVTLPLYLRFIRLGTHESVALPLFMYDLASGLYTRNEDIIDMALLQFQPGLTIKNSEEVRRQIRIQSAIKPEHSDPQIANVKNGMFNIVTKELQPYTPDLINIRKIETTYNPTSQHPVFANGWTFEGWLDEQFTDDNEKIFMWQLIQFLPLVGRAKGVFVLMFDQLGNTGKGMFQDILQNLTGSANTGNSTMVKLNSQFGLAPVFDKTLIISGENDATYMADNGNLKNVATGDTVSVEPKGKDAFAARCTALMVFASNSMPRFGKMDAGVKRRVRVQEFRVSYTGRVNHAIRDEYIKDQNFLEYLLFKALNQPFRPEIVDSDSSQALKREIELSSNFAYDYVINRLNTFPGKRLPYNIIFADAEAYAVANGRKFGFEQNNFVREVTAELRKAGRLFETKPARFNTMTKDDYDWFYNFRSTVPNSQIGIWLPFASMTSRLSKSQRGIIFNDTPPVAELSPET